MNIGRVFACMGLITGFFLILGLEPMEFTDAVFQAVMRKPKGIRGEIREAASEKKSFFLRQEIEAAQDILRLTGKESRISMLCAYSLLLFSTGVMMAVLIGNPFMVPVLSCGLMFLPFWYVKLMESHYKKDIAGELETALSIITTAYLRSEDIIRAIEENQHYLNPPVSSVFQEFLAQLKMISPDVDAALKNLRKKIRNDVFEEWVDAVSACQYDRSLKTTLPPIVNKLSDMRIINGELENLVFEPRKEFITMVILVIGNIPLMYMLNRDWYQVLMFTPFGQFLLAGSAAVIFVSTAFVIKLTRPIEYRR